MNEKIILDRKGKKVITITFNDEKVDCEYYSNEDDEDVIKAVILEGLDIVDFFDFTSEDFTSIAHIDILKSEIGDNIVVGYGIYKNYDDFKIIFYINDIVSWEKIDGWGANQYLEVLEKIAISHNDVDIHIPLEDDSAVFSMAIAITCNFNFNIRDAFFKARKIWDSLLTQTETSLKKFDEIINASKIPIKLPEEFRTAVRQYLLFFEDFIYISKGKYISMNILKNKDGLELDIKPNSEISAIDIRNWFNEYIELSRQSINNLKIEFEQEVSAFTADLLIADLKNQIAHLNNSIEIAKLKNKSLLNENKYLRKLMTSFSKNLPVTQKKEVNQNKTSLKLLVSQGEIKKVIKEIKIIFSNDDRAYNEIIMIEARYNRMQYSIRNGIVNEDILANENNKINSSLLEVIDNIE